MNELLTTPNFLLPSNIEKKENKFQQPTWDYFGEMPPDWDHDDERSIRINKINRFLKYFQSNQISKEIFYQELLPSIGVKKDVKGNIILYHATSFELLKLIIRDKKIRSSSETGKRSWRIEGEVEGEKTKKIYLATKFQIPYTAASVPFGKYVMEVRVAPNKLRIDEDNYKKERSYAWLYSLSGGMTCSHFGNIDTFSLVGKLDTYSETDHSELAWLKSKGVNIDKIKLLVNEVNHRYHHIYSWKKIEENFTVLK